MHLSRTYTGEIVDIGQPDASKVRLLDVAHGLSLINRYNGATEGAYSVAQHCVIVSYYVDRQHALRALLHDAAEAYLGDVTRAVKRRLDEQLAAAGLETFSQLEARWLEAIWDTLGDEGMYFRLSSENAIKEIDDRVCLDEMAAQLPGWTIDQYSGVGTTEPLGVFVHPWGPRFSERKFLSRYHELRA